MTMAPLRDALATLRQALRASGIIDHSDDLVIELPYEAGFRFEAWAVMNAPPLVRLENQMSTWTPPDAPMTPQREFAIDGIKFRWPVRLVALEGGGTMPEPAAEMMVCCIGPDCRGLNTQTPGGYAVPASQCRCHRERAQAPRAQVHLP